MWCHRLHSLLQVPGKRTISSDLTGISFPVEVRWCKTAAVNSYKKGHYLSSRLITMKSNYTTGPLQTRPLPFSSPFLSRSCQVSPKLHLPAKLHPFLPSSTLPAKLHPFLPSSTLPAKLHPFLPSVISTISAKGITLLRCQIAWLKGALLLTCHSYGRWLLFEAFRKDGCWWIELQYCHCKFHYKSTREQHSSTTMIPFHSHSTDDSIPDLLISWKPAATLTEINVFTRYS